MPVIHVPVGSEEMSSEDIFENVQAVLEMIRSKVNDSNIKSVYLKLTMGKPIKVD